MYASGASGVAGFCGVSETELCGDHQRRHEILRGRRVKVRRRHGRGRFWRARLLRPLRRALLLTPLLAVGRTVDDGARLVG